MTESRDASAPVRRPLPTKSGVPAPEGFAPVEIFDPFEAHVGPQFERIEADGSRIAAFVADERHVREDGTVHEGMMLTFADAFMGGAAWRGSGGRSCVTLSMQASQFGEAKLGDTIFCRTSVDHRTRAIIFISADFTVGDQRVMTATSLWKVLGER